MPLSLQTFPTVGKPKPRSAPARAISAAERSSCAPANEGDLSCDTLVRTSDPALRRIEIADRNVSIGASVTMAAVARHPALSALAAAARAVGGPAIRNMATVGGNLFAPDALWRFRRSHAGARRPGGDRRANDAISTRSCDVRERLDGIVARRQLRLPAAEAFRFVKVARVRPKGVSVLSIAAVIEADADGHGRRRRGSRSAAWRTVRSAPQGAEEALIGAQLTGGRHRSGGRRR